TGINSSAISYGLGVVVADINLDGYPDLYVGNDFHENDYLYINQKNGTFSEENNQRLMHTSQFSMGVDV
ncbi:VCBS repeat-containing protein, partial [Streptomyces sp. UMAF16]|nr:VCBS repeat-containing protein [Streptomyces sp. UMAF16]